VERTRERRPRASFHPWFDFAYRLTHMTRARVATQRTHPPPYPRFPRFETAGARRGSAKIAVRAPACVFATTASSAVGATHFQPARAVPSESLAMAAAVAGARVTLPSHPESKFGEFFKTHAANGKALVAHANLGSSALFLISAAMSYKEQKMVALITQAVGSFIKLYLLLLFVRVLLTWFPNVDWMRQPWSILRQITDPYLNLFRNLIPPIMGQIDFTPILGFMVLQFLAKVLSSDPSVGRF